MKTTTRVSEKGQMVIPKRLRDRLGIRPGQLLECHEERGRLVLQKVAEGDVFDRLTGIVKLPYTTDELFEMMRGRPISSKKRK